MGRNKAFVRISGRPLIEHQLEKLRQITKSIYISTNDARPFGYLGIPVLRDLYPGQGPLAGLHAALNAMPNDLVLLLACDVPGVGEQLLRRLILECAGHDAVVPRTTDGRLHPLCAVYRSQTCLPVIEESLAAGRNGVAACLAGSPLRVLELRPEHAGFEGSDLANINTLSDLQAYPSRP